MMQMLKDLFNFGGVKTPMLSGECLVQRLEAFLTKEQQPVAESVLQTKKFGDVRLMHCISGGEDGVRYWLTLDDEHQQTVIVNAGDPAKERSRDVCHLGLDKNGKLIQVGDNSSYGMGFRVPRFFDEMQLPLDLATKVLMPVISEIVQKGVLKNR